MRKAASQVLRLTDEEIKNFTIASKTKKQTMSECMWAR